MSLVKNDSGKEHIILLRMWRVKVIFKGLTKKSYSCLMKLLKEKKVKQWYIEINYRTYNQTIRTR